MQPDPETIPVPSDEYLATLDKDRFKADGTETPRIELMKEAQAFLQELFDAEILLPAEQEHERDPSLILGDGVPFDRSADYAEQLASRLRELIARERKGIEEMHPLVKCTSCGEQATYCDFGNNWCPSCGETLDGAPEVEDDSAKLKQEIAEIDAKDPVVDGNQSDVPDYLR